MTVGALVAGCCEEKTKRQQQQQQQRSHQQQVPLFRQSTSAVGRAGVKSLGYRDVLLPGGPVFNISPFFHWLIG